MFFLTDSTPNLKLQKITGTLVILFYVSPSSPQLPKTCCFYQIHKKTYFSINDWWEYISSFFQENGRTLLKIRLLKKLIEFQDREEDCENSTKNKTINQKLNQ